MKDPTELAQTIRRYSEKRISLARAAEEAGLSLYEMMDELRLRNIALDQTSPEEARADLERLLERMG